MLNEANVFIILGNYGLPSYKLNYSDTRSTN